MTLRRSAETRSTSGAPCEVLPANRRPGLRATRHGNVREQVRTTRPVESSTVCEVSASRPLPRLGVSSPVRRPRAVSVRPSPRSRASTSVASSRPFVIAAPVR